MTIQDPSQCTARSLCREVFKPIRDLSWKHQPNHSQRIMPCEFQSNSMGKLHSACSECFLLSHSHPASYFQAPPYPAKKPCHWITFTVIYPCWSLWTLHQFQAQRVLRHNPTKFIDNDKQVPGRLHGLFRHCFVNFCFMYGNLICPIRCVFLKDRAPILVNMLVFYIPP